MTTALRAKFTQHPRFRRVLLSTGNALLAEHTERDHYWVDGGDRTGQNMLGRLLMELRDSLRTEFSRSAADFCFNGHSDLARTNQPAQCSCTDQDSSVATDRKGGQRRVK